ncbi:MAG: monofunctional biosynthetic peptidoglycan transglycosylase [Bacteroidetes bacterium]|nr:monofunctional biosynthetic peptidoglycan transglycosylase [Bacteroidota bacterium]
MKNKLDSSFFSFIKTSLKVVILFAAITSIVVVIYRFLPVTYSAYMNDVSNETFMDIISLPEIDREWVSYKNISSQIKIAVIASEDQMFIDHMGFDLKQIEIAWDQIQRGRRMRGASTISQQVAKNLFLWNTKSFVRKGLEAYYTVLIELLWSKKRILEVYLNIAEFGKNTFGAEAAAKKYFKKPAIKLRAGEAAIMAAVLPNPIRMKVNAPSAYVLRRQARILKQMSNIGGIGLLKQIE